MVFLAEKEFTPVCRPDEPVPARGQVLNQLLSLMKFSAYDSRMYWGK